MANTYREIVQALSDGRIPSEMLTSQIRLYATWCETHDEDHVTADLQDYCNWLLGWGFPPRAASMHVDAIKRLREGT